MSIFYFIILFKMVYLRLQKTNKKAQLLALFRNVNDIATKPKYIFVWKICCVLNMYFLGFGI